MDALEEELPPVADARLSLLGDTPVATLDQWQEAAAAVLRKAGRLGPEDPASAAPATLARTTLDGIAVPALATEEDLSGLPDNGVPGNAPFTRGRTVSRPDGWDIRALVAQPDAGLAAQSALTDLEKGAVSLWLRVGDSGTAIADLGQVLAGVFLDFGPVVLDPDSTVDPIEAARAFAAVLAERHLEPAAGGNLGADPIGASLRAGTPADSVGKVVTAVATVATELGIRALVVDGTAVHDAGATDAQELGYSLAVGAAYLRLLTTAGYDVDEACALMEFRYAATDEQFPTIAKFRAARRLWHRVTELSGVAEESRAQAQHAVTSRPMMTRYDSYTNMLRTTVAAFAAGVGGADAVTVLPFDDAIGQPSVLARRIARNTSSLLISEAHLSAVSDPAGGSYAVEALTDSIARAAWAQFDLIESAGGVLAAIADGSIAERVSEAAARRALLIAKRKQPITGVSEFPNAAETLPDREPHHTAPINGLAPISYADQYEEMRDQPTATPVFLATLGPVAAHTARATFATNLLTSGGVAVVGGGLYADIPAMVEEFSASSTEVACLAGTDSAYAEVGAEAVEALRAAGARSVILSGKPPEGLEVDDHLAVGIDALAFLRRTRETLSTGQDQS